ncbi:MAG TPA: hypothetical protein VKT82_06615, partial [Ktedonobacterales bacterium]|nr:hypothetical protein [Ktedonobacterales bacterium]
QFYMLGWIADYPDPQDWIDLVETGNPNNTMNFSNPAGDTLTQQADSSLNANQRNSDYAQVEEQAVQQVAWIPFAQGKNIFVYQKYVQNFGFDAQGLIPDISWPSVQILAH